MCTSIMPGPKEQMADEVQRYLRLIVSNLLCLWKHGIKIPTPSCPDGRLVWVILIAIVCDKPAAHKLAGFASHSHTYYCTECWICSQDKMNQSAFERGSKQTSVIIHHCHMLLSIPQHILNIQMQSSEDWGKNTTTSHQKWHGRNLSRKMQQDIRSCLICHISTLFDKPLLILCIILFLAS
jgi:hypothetical protein